MNKNYLKGRRAEYKVMRILESQGYICVRSAGSHGIDIVGFLGVPYNPSELPLIRAISVKATRYASKKDINEMRALKLPFIVSKELWHFKPKTRGIAEISYLGGRR